MRRGNCNLEIGYPGQALYDFERALSVANSSEKSENDAILLIVHRLVSLPMLINQHVYPTYSTATTIEYWA